MKSKNKSNAKRYRKKPPAHMQPSKINKKISSLPIFDYNSMPVDNPNLDRFGNFKIPKVIKRSLIVLAVIAVLIFLQFYHSDITLDNFKDFMLDSFWYHSTNTGFPVSISGDKVEPSNIMFMGDNIAYVSDTSVSVFNSSAGVKGTRVHVHSSPVLKTSSNRLLIYNQSSTAFQIDYADENIFSGEASNTIQVADISDNGNYVLVTDSNDFLSEMTVYNSNNSEIYRYMFAHTYIYNVSISHDGTKLCATGVKTKNAELNTTIYTFDISSETPMAEEDFSDMVVNLKSLNNGNALFVGNDTAGMFGQGGFQSVSYSDEVLCCSDINSSNDILLVLSAKNGSNCSCMVINSSGEQTAHFDTNLHVTGCALGSDIALLADGQLYRYGTDSKLISSQTVGADTKKVLYAGGNCCYILNLNQVKKIYF